MTREIGDLITSAGQYGRSGVVIEQNGDRLKLDTTKEAIEKNHKFMNTSGAPIEDKVEFNKIVEDIADQDDVRIQVKELQKKIDELKQQGGNRQLLVMLTSYHNILKRQIEKNFHPPKNEI